MLSKSRSTTLIFLVMFLLLVVTVHSQDDEDDVCAGSTPQTSCPVNCFRTDPVDGVTNWFGSGDALCSDTKVAKLGFCEIGNNGIGDTGTLGFCEVGNNGIGDTGAASLPAQAQALLLFNILWLIVVCFTLFFGLY
ncbi:hypothetical protein CFOL_v3_22637 [Cephalotus follicularis]|uniref:Transmembrane protein n=1 Tax=Cephalotus follicularis TaxID=3775 RepID=A0A1Q3CGC4_CEPFO|nr:hypothetical protein CFOL_v3_22637 [Cephalotus follicularis]